MFWDIAVKDYLALIDGNEMSIYIAVCIFPIFCTFIQMEESVIVISRKPNKPPIAQMLIQDKWHDCRGFSPFRLKHFDEVTCNGFTIKIGSVE